MGKLLDAIQTYVDANGGIRKARTKATDDIVAGMRNDENSVVPIAPKKIRPGCMYFLMWDIGGKASLMEKMLPILCVDRRRIGMDEYLFGISMCFIPTLVRAKFFDVTLPNYDLSLKEAGELPANEEDDLVPVDFEGAYNSLATIGFEYSIRKIDAKKINKAYAISTRYVPQMMLLDTIRFTNVDEGKLGDIWKAKINQQDERRRKVVKEMLDGFTQMGKEMNEAIYGVINKSDAAAKVLSKLKLSSG